MKKAFVVLSLVLSISILGCGGEKTKNTDEGFVPDNVVTETARGTEGSQKKSMKGKGSASFHIKDGKVELTTIKFKLLKNYKINAELKYDNIIFNEVYVYDESGSTIVALNDGNYRDKLTPDNFTDALKIICQEVGLPEETSFETSGDLLYCVRDLGSGTNGYFLAKNNSTEWLYIECSESDEQSTDIITSVEQAYNCSLDSLQMSSSDTSYESTFQEDEPRFFDE